METFALCRYGTGSLDARSRGKNHVVSPTDMGISHPCHYEANTPAPRGRFTAVNGDFTPRPFQIRKRTRGCGPVRTAANPSKNNDARSRGCKCFTQEDENGLDDGTVPLLRFGLIDKSLVTWSHTQDIGAAGLIERYAGRNHDLVG